ncbi:hypothetical protein V6N13_065327 [Hibiscus sabdariffa]
MATAGLQMSPQLEQIHGEIRDLFRALSNGFQRLDKMKDSNRQSKQLEELTGKMRECKRLIKEFDREIKGEESKNPPEVNKQLNDEKQSMIKELNSYVALRKTYMNTLGNKKIELFDMGAGVSEPTADENVKVASSMSNQELVDHGMKTMDETDQVIERSKKVVEQTIEVGTQTASTLKGQTDQMGRIVNELDTIQFSIKKASQLVKEIGRQVATDKCIMLFLFLIVCGVIAIIVVKMGVGVLGSWCLRNLMLFFALRFYIIDSCLRCAYPDMTTRTLTSTMSKNTSNLCLSAPQWRITKLQVQLSACQRLDAKGTLSKHYTYSISRPRNPSLAFNLPSDHEIEGDSRSLLLHYTAICGPDLPLLRSLPVAGSAVTVKLVLIVYGTEHEKTVHEVIRSKKDMGASQWEMKREINVADNIITKCIKSLLSKNLIKEVKSIQSRGRKHYMSAEFEPSSEITGGAWYVEGSLDTEYINVLKEQCWRKIYGMKVATLEGIADALRRSNVSQIELSKQQVEEIVKALVLDNQVMEVKSTGTGEFASIPVGKVCYKCIGKRGYGGEPKLGALASIPCGVCPQISRCTPDGIISPNTCAYYQKWLDF